MNLFFYKTAIGRIGIAEESGFITHLFFETDISPSDADIRETDLLREAYRQLNAYLAGRLKEFSLPTALTGTDFMKTVWNCLRDIPYGATASYKEIAAASGHPSASRAAGAACGRNPIPIIIPCHRVIGSTGKITGYRGGIALKKILLELEEKNRNA